ncbi:hypothetical protein [Paracoccus lutimaris]|uniref:AAA+ family ATPase n=1 Tax=Paracoccus lutimaris TaxID=1490030 RepID=A0A368ZB61_9RHOB|nr:hypothetical protein [Paracoccus lutimaris]RCW88726.1 hypothetical protein DFP89_101161 [Paracoccus lutimaris]
MRRFPALILAAALSLPVVVIAQQWTPPGADQDPAPESDSGGSIFERGMESFMQNMLKEAEPHLDRLGRDLGDTVNSLRPVLGDIGALMDDVKNYQAPERLENGDILIRRRADAPPPPPVGNALRDMLRPAPEDDPSLPPPDGAAPRVPDQPLPEAEPGTEIEL